MASDIEVLARPGVHNRTFHFVGLAFMALNQWRHRIQGYRTPRPIAPRNTAEALRYDRAVVANWLRHLRSYEIERPTAGSPADRDILELGPGLDLGTGLLLLAAGARSYLAVDAHPLLMPSPETVHRALAERIASEENLDDKQRNELLQAASSIRPDGRLAYRHLPDFDLRSVDEESVDLVLAHSSFEHLSDVDRTLAQLSTCARSGAVLVAEIDFQTHTRWLRDQDPLNIYRYRTNLYRNFAFNGSPNRVRPDEYLEILDNHGWQDPRFFPRRVLDQRYVRAVEPALARRFRGDVEQLGWMSVVLCATRAKRPRFGSR